MLPLRWWVELEEWDSFILWANTSSVLRCLQWEERISCSFVTALELGSVWNQNLFSIWLYLNLSELSLMPGLNYIMGLPSWPKFVTLHLLNVPHLALSAIFYWISFELSHDHRKTVLGMVSRLPSCFVSLIFVTIMSEIHLY